MKIHNNEKVQEMIDAKIELGEYVEVTCGRNGYPEGIHKVVTFDARSEAEEFADSTGLRMVKIRRRDGWGLYESRGAFFGGELTIEDFGFGATEDAIELDNIDDYRRWLTDENSGLDEEDMMDEDEKATAAIEALKKGEFAVFIDTDNGLYHYGTYNRDAAKWHDSDVWTYQIAVEV